MGEEPSSPQPHEPARLEYGQGEEEKKGTMGSRLILVMVWGLGLVSWAVWVGILIYLFVRFVA